MHVLNLGVLAHVDAGKTSLTERLLHTAGVIDEPGSVDAGNTRTDTLDLERQRGITIRSAVVSFEVDGVTVNLIDTPGHPDFVAEVERVLGVLDGVVLVVSAVEGVQAQTRVLMRTLQRLGLPTLLFVNKIDRAGAREADLVDEIRRRLSPDVVPLGTTRDRGTAAASYVEGLDRDSALDLLTGSDERLLADVVEDRPVGDHRLRRALAGASRRAEAHALMYGSAITGAGVPEVLAAVTTYLPVRCPDGEGPLRGTVFKIERGPAGEKLAWLCVSHGTLRVRDRITLDGAEDRVTGIDLADDGGTHEVGSLPAGRIGRVRGLAHARVGDRFGPDAGDERHWFAPPSLETVVDPVRERDRGRLHVALTQITEQDPMVGLRRDEDGELAVSLYGEVQKEVLEATLAAEYGVAVSFRPTTTICVERVVGSGSSAERIDDDANPFLAGVGLRVDPAPEGAGVSFRLEVELGSMPPAFFTAVEEGVRALLRQGVHGWDVPDAVVTLTSSAYYPRQSHAHGTFDKSMSSTAADFRTLAPLVLMDALREAGTVVHEPVHRLRLEVPADTLGAVLSALARHRGVPDAPEIVGDVAVVGGEVPAIAVHTLRSGLPHLTRGEGLLETAFRRHRPVSGQVPEQARRDDDPRDRRRYLLAAARRVGRAVVE